MVTEDGDREERDHVFDQLLELAREGVERRSAQPCERCHDDPARGAAFFVEGPADQILAWAAENGITLGRRDELVEQALLPKPFYCALRSVWVCGRCALELNVYPAAHIVLGDEPSYWSAILRSGG